MKKMKGINGGDKIPKADVKLPESTEKLNEILKKKSSKELVKDITKAKKNEKPTVEDFLPLLKGLDVKLVEIKNNYTAIKDKQGKKVLTYVRDTSYGFSFENRSDKGIWLVEKITKKSQLDEKVDVIKQRLRD